MRYFEVDSANFSVFCGLHNFEGYVCCYDQYDHYYYYYH